MSSRHPFRRRFGFPGFAEIVWVLPEGVAHDEPWYEPLPWNAACRDLEDWSLDPAQHDLLRELHQAVFGAPLVEPAGVPIHALVAPLDEAFRDGRLVAWALRPNAVTRPAALVTPKPQPLPKDTSKTWIEIVLRDEDGVPVANEPYRLTLPNGERRSGTLDARGFARVDGIDPGTCDVTFPRIDGREWRRA